MGIQKLLKIYRDVCDSNDEATSLKNENTFFSVIIIIMLISGSLANLVCCYYILHENTNLIIFNSIGLIIASMLFLLFSRIIKSERLKMYVYSVLVSLVLVFSVNQFYHIIGPAVWSISVVMGILILIYSKGGIFIIYSITNCITNLLVWYNGFKFNNWEAYYLAQTILFAMMFISILVVYKVIKSRQKKTYEQYQNICIAEKKLYSTLASVGDGVIAVDEKGIIDFINPVAQQLTGWDQETACGKTFESIFNIINEYTRQPIESPVQKVFKSNEIIELANHTLLVSKDGFERAIEDTAAPIKNICGNIIGVVIVFRDFSDKKEKRKQIEYLSYHDQMTGLYNRRFFEEELIRLDTQRNLPISIVYADVNGLKTMNDAFGHQNGDLLIQKVAHVLKNEFRSDDIISRIGGDEFVILLPKTAGIFTENLVKRIKMKLEEEVIMNINLSVSFGCATKNLESQFLLNVLKNSEELMYHSKIYSNASKKGDVIKSILNTLLLKNPREEAHSKRVSRICEDIAKAYDLSYDQINEIKLAGELHDIGKISIDEIILNKPGKLSDSEWAQIQLHPETGYRLLETTNEFYKIAEYIRSHHERWDGMGYPKRLAGESIPWISRIISIADAYDAMTSDRTYRKALTIEEAVAEIKSSAGKQFDPEIVKVFIEKVLGL